MLSDKGEPCTKKYTHTPVTNIFKSDVKSKGNETSFI